MEIPVRYLSAKWQAYVTTPGSGFVFANGLEVVSMWELKQAWLGVPEEVFVYHLADGRNDYADWVKNSVGDVELADELRNQTQRWGMIVALERRMMRALSLPNYVAKRWLAPAYEAFVFQNGHKVTDLNGLVKTLAEVEDDVVVFHCERYPNDIARWVGEVVGDYELAELLTEAVSKQQMLRFVEDHVAMLREALEV